MPPTPPHKFMPHDRPRRRTLRTARLRLAALEWRPRATRKVLALHGWMDNAASFATLAPWLTDCHLVAVDLPGHGRSAHRPPGMAYHFIDYVGDALAAADALGWETFDLLGHSLGAGVGTLVAAVAPRRVRSLVLIEGIGPATGGGGGAAEQLGAAIAQMARSPSPGQPARRYGTIAEVVEARRAAGAMSAEAAALLVRRNLVRGADGYRWRTDRRLRFRSPLYLAESQVRDFLGQIRCASLLVIGRQSQTLSAAMLRRRRNWIAGLQTVRVDGGHHLHMDYPEPVAQVVNRFYRETRNARRAE